MLELLKKNIKNTVKNLYGQSSTANETSVKGVDWLQGNVREYRNIYLVWKFCSCLIIPTTTFVAIKL